VKLRSRLLIGTVVVALVLVGSAIVVIRTTERFLTDRLDEQLVAAIPFAQRRVTSQVPNLPPPANVPDQDRNLSNLFVGSISASGQLTVAARPGLSARDLPTPDIQAAQARTAASTRDPKPFTVGSRSGSDTRYRVVTVPVLGSDQVNVVALPLSDVDAAVSRLILVAGVSTILVLTILGLVTFWVLRLGVRPIRRMTGAAKVIADGDLSHRVPPARAGTEAGDLGAAFNVMVARIENAFDRQARSESRLRQFVADASHELRTPVTTISGYAQLYRDGALEDPEELANAMRRTGQEASRMAGLVDGMLLLTRLDQGLELERSAVNLGSIATDAVADARATDPDRWITTDVTDGVVVVGDENRLRQVAANVVRNALVHTPSSASVHVSVDRLGRRAALVVRDAGPGMDADAAAHAFERFYRADAGRSRDRGGSGLGLAISRSIVEAHGGWIALDTEPGQGTTVRIELPCAVVAASAVTPDGPVSV
jgi:two-component system, OmpR family, sensor kinase